jgi:predicted ester cyclase
VHPGLNRRESALSGSDAVDAVRSAVSALNDGDIEGYLAHFEPSSKRWIGGVPTPLVLTDIEDNLHQMQAALADLHLDEDVLFGDERFVCARWRLRGRHVADYLGFTPTGQSIDFETCEVYEIDAGRVIATWVYSDFDQLIRQLSPS